MKRMGLFTTSGVLASLVFAAAAWAGPQSPAQVAVAGGGADGGGGNGLRTVHTTEEVAAQIDHEYGLRLGVGLVLRDIGAGLVPHSSFPILEPRVRRVFSAITRLAGHMHPFAYAKQYLHFEKKLDGSCQYKGEDRDASLLKVTHRASKAEPARVSICLSLPRIAQYPDFKEQLLMLVIHELAHAAGFGEDEAVFAQKSVLPLLTGDCFVQITLNRNENHSSDLIRINAESPFNHVYPVFIREFNSTGENSIQTKQSNSEKDFSFRWSPARDQATLKFLVANFDGSSSPVEIVFAADPSAVSSDPHNPASRILSSKLRINGEERVPTQLTFSGGCLR
jgi:hypothetical protein